MAGEQQTSVSELAKTPIELWAELKDLVASLERDAQKATRGMKAGGIRLRASLQLVKEKVMELRKAVLEHRISRRRKDDDEDEPDNTPAKTKVKVTDKRWSKTG